MKNLLRLMVFWFLIIPQVSTASDTISVMHYNLLYYDMNTSWCTSTNNNVVDKNSYLREITNHYKPDILTVNEMNGSVTSVDKLLNNVFKLDESSPYKRANYTGSYLVNMLYYNSDKLVLKSQSYVLTSPRISDVYHLYYKSDDLVSGDTTFLTCIVTHLKAGSSASDASERATATQQIMSYISNRNLQGNILFMGDLNVYSAYETAFQRLVTASSNGVQLNDPINELGDWQNNFQFSSYHSQSTHTSGDCHSGGGFDDRFDFILASSPVIDGTRGLKYIEDSYWAFGQDGNRLNQSLLSPSNNTLPTNVINALYYMSDHLPIVMKLEIDKDLYTGISEQDHSSFKMKVVNPVFNSINFSVEGNRIDKANIQVINLLGSVVYENSMPINPGDQIQIDAADFTPGIYLLRITGNNKRIVTKILKQ